MILITFAEGIWSYPPRTPKIPDRLTTRLELAFSPRWREDGANGASKTRRRPPRPLPHTHTRSERGTRVPCPGTHVADVVDLDREGRNRPCAAGMSDATQSSFTRAARVVAFLGAARAPCGPCAAELGPLRRRSDLLSPLRRSSDLSSHRSTRYWAVKMDKASNGPLRGRDNARAAERPVTRPSQTSRGRLHQ